jgi:hypothetical protein
MWLWECELRELGFRRKSPHYWQCQRRYDLPPHAHLSIFSWSEQQIPPARGKSGRLITEVTEFHITFLIRFEHLHFYYHEGWPNQWRPAGHTSRREIRRVHEDPAALRQQADASARQFAESLGGNLLSRKRKEERAR